MRENRPQRHWDERDLTRYCAVLHNGTFLYTKYKLCWFFVGPQDVAGHAACADGAGSIGAEWSRTDSMPRGAQAYRVGPRYDGIPHRSRCGKSSTSFDLKRIFVRGFVLSLQCDAVSLGEWFSKISKAPYDPSRWRQYLLSASCQEAFPHYRQCRSQDDLNFQKHR